MSAPSMPVILRKYPVVQKMEMDFGIDTVAKEEDV
jgi:hypothetical protein